jgi:hypothetical protein
LCAPNLWIQSALAHAGPLMLNSRLLPLTDGLVWNGALKYDVVTVPPAQSLQSDQLVVVSWTASNTVAVLGTTGSREEGVLVGEVVPEEVVPVDVGVVVPGVAVVELGVLEEGVLVGVVDAGVADDDNDAASEFVVDVEPPQPISVTADASNTARQLVRIALP